MNGRLKLLLSQWKIIVMAAIMIFIAVAVYKVLRHKELPLLPTSILHLALTEETKGEAARQLINAMHNNIMTPEDNLIGMYVSPDGTGTLYLSVYHSTEEANAACDTMEHSIARGNSAFTHFRTISTGGHHYVMCLGSGKAHYIFVHNAKLYWWSVDIPVAQASIRDLLKRVQTQE
jgi:hypothetical protein